MAIQRRGAAPDLPGDLGGRHGAGCQHCLRRRDLDGVQRRRATTDTATGAAGCQGGSGALTQKLHLELPEGGEDVEDQPPGRAGGVDVLVQRSQTDATCLPRCPRWSEAGAWIAPDGRAGRRPAHHPRGRIPRRRQAAGDRLGCRSSIPRTPARTRRHGGRRSDHQWFADRSRRGHSRPTSEVSQKSSYPRAIETRVSGLSSGMLHGRFQDGIGTNLEVLAKTSVYRRLSRAAALEQSIQSRPLVAPLGATDALVAVDRHDRPAKPSSGLLERL